MNIVDRSTNRSRDPRSFSVVITNFNYENFVGKAIDSALALDWPSVEVIVVDDGSTDRSRAVIDGYGDKIVKLFTSNHGQRAAVNAGFQLSSGNLVVFLDSDDELPPELARKAFAVWNPAVSKVQAQMRRIRSDSHPYGQPFPIFDPMPTPSDISMWFQKTTAYPTPPGSGNVYSRDFLLRIFPLDDSIGTAPDSGCLAAAPLFGEVISLPGVMVGYRQHGENDSFLLADYDRFAREVRRAKARWSFAQRARHPDREVDETPLHRSRELLQFRVAASRTQPGVGLLSHDARHVRIKDSLLAILWPGPEPMRSRVLLASWCLAVELSPYVVVPWLLRLRWGRPGVNSNGSTT